MPDEPPPPPPVSDSTRSTGLPSNIAAALWDRSDFYVTTLNEGHGPLADRIAGAHDEHVAIMRAIERGDGEAARLAMERHIAAYEPGYSLSP